MKNREILVSQATPGMILARDVLDYNGKMLVSKDTSLTDKIISRLQFYAIQTIHIYLNEDKHIAAVSMKPSTNSIYIVKSHKQKIASSKEFKQFKEDFFETIEFYQTYITDAVLNNKTLDVDQILSKANQLIGNSRNMVHLFNMLTCMKDFDDSTYSHCINVSLLCNIYGQWLNLPNNEIEILTLCGLFHDIGKLRIPQSIVMKPAKLTADEYTIIKKHTLIGYDLLKDMNIDERIKKAALMHHERVDGSGYPNHLKGSQIDIFPRLVSIADVYDALTSKRVYRDSLCPFDVLQIFEKEEYTKYDTTYVRIFFEKLFETYIMNPIRLNDGSEGKLIMLNKHALGQPIVQIGSKFIDLSKEKTLKIQAIL